MEETKYLLVGNFELIVMFATNRTKLKSENKIFITNISSHINNRELHSIFSSTPYDYYVNIVKDRNGKSLNHGFIHLFTPNCVSNVLNKFQGIVLKGGQALELKAWEKKKEREISKLNSYHKTLYISKLRDTVSHEELIYVFKGFGEIASSDLKPANPKKFYAKSNYAVIEFKTEEQAEAVLGKAPKNKLVQDLFVSGQVSISYFQPPQSRPQLSNKEVSKKETKYLNPLNRRALHSKPFIAPNGSTYMKPENQFSTPQFFNQNQSQNQLHSKIRLTSKQFTQPKANLIPIIDHKEDSFYSISNQTFQSLNNTTYNNSSVKSQNNSLMYEKEKNEVLLKNVWESSQARKKKF